MLGVVIQVLIVKTRGCELQYKHVKGAEPRERRLLVFASTTTTTTVDVNCAILSSIP